LRRRSKRDLIAHSVSSVIMPSPTALPSIKTDDETVRRLSRCEDIALLPLPEEEIILQLLAARYANNQIYSKCGDVLLAINPYCNVTELLYTVETLFQYSNAKCLSALDELPPHPWKTAAKAFICLGSVGDDDDDDAMMTNQSIVISGESGSNL
jgi:myosin heavy subunit